MAARSDGVNRDGLVELLKARAGIVRDIRAFFDGRGFVEVETPVRIAAPAPEPNIDCPVVPSRAGMGTTYLRASPELQMKKLLAAGMDRIYQIGPCFREGENGSRHRPEFTMMEWYRRGAGYLDILEDMKELFRLLSGRHVPSGGSADRPFKTISVRDAYLSWAGWDPWERWDQDRFDVDMATKVEPALKQLGIVFLMDYPQQAASLARLRGDVAERWELYVDGMELANCFTELCDPAEQRDRFMAAKEERMALGESDYPIDEDFIASLAGIGSAAGVALGIDRLAMTLLGVGNISDLRCPQ